MRQMRRLGPGWIFALSAVAGVVALAVPRVEAFEGVVKWRTLKVGTAPLAKVAEDPADAAKVFAVPLEALMRMHGEAKVSEVTLYVKGSRIRSETHGAPSYILMDLDGGTTQVVMTEQKKVLDVTPQDIQALEARGKTLKRMRGRAKKSAGEQSRGESAGPAPLVALDLTETINGFQASAFEARDPSETVRGWVTRDKPEIEQLFARLERYRTELTQRNDLEQGARQALARKGVPVRVLTLDEKNYTWEDLIELREESVADDLFVAPAGFTHTAPAKLGEAAGVPPAVDPKP